MDDDIVSSKSSRHQVYRGMSPTTSNRLEVRPYIFYCLRLFSIFQTFLCFLRNSKFGFRFEPIALALQHAVWSAIGILLASVCPCVTIRDEV